MKSSKVIIGDRPWEFAVQGETLAGDNRVLLDEDDNLIAGAPWEAAGYANIDLLSASEFAALKTGLEQLVAGELSRIRGSTVALEFERYHQIIDSDEEHLALMGAMQPGFFADRLPIPLERLEAGISRSCGREVWCHNPHRGSRKFQLRLVRPQRPQDSNPPHRDVWVDDLRHAVNTFVPIAGCTANSALPLIPGSHRWPESAIERTAAGARINGVRYHVPTVVKAQQPLHLVRPNPTYGQGMVFSPYLIHGGGINFNEDVTRVSLELRLWRRPDALA